MNGETRPAPGGVHVGLGCAMELAAFRASLDGWLDEHHHELAPYHSGPGTLDEHMAHLAKVKRLAYDDGWMRWGWPPRVGGLGGSSLLRAYLGEALTFVTWSSPAFTP